MTVMVKGLSTGNVLTSDELSPQGVSHVRRICINESVVCTCSIAYMRAGIGNDRLVVCLSEYLPLRTVYRISSMSTILVA